MAHGGQIVDFVGLNLLDDADQIGGVGQVAVVQDEIAVADMWILVQMVYAIRVERRRAALDAVDDVAFAEQKFCQIGAILAGDSCDKGNFGHVSFMRWCLERKIPLVGIDAHCTFCRYWPESEHDAVNAKKQSIFNGEQKACAIVTTRQPGFRMRRTRCHR